MTTPTTTVSSIPQTMRAVVIYEAGGPEVLKVEDRPVPSPREGHVLIQVRAFGLNRSEMFTRQGLSPNVKFPRILGIEATGTVASCPGNEFQVGDTVITAMGGLGRDFDGSYAQYTLVPAPQCQKISIQGLAWPTLAALPETLQTAWGSLFKALQLQPHQSPSSSQPQRLLIRGGTTSVGLAAASIARNHGIFVGSTTRRADRSELLLSNGAQEIYIDDGAIAAQIASKPGGVSVHGFDKILELVGTTTLADSLQCARPGGAVCMTGMVGNSWSFQDFSPMEKIPSTVNLTVYSGGSEEFLETPLGELAEQVKEGKLAVKIGKIVQGLEGIVEAHRLMEGVGAGGKIVVVV